MFRRSSKNPIYLLVGLALLCCYSSTAHAQPSDLELHPENYIELQDDVYIGKMMGDGHRINDSSIVSAAYRYEFVYDSTCRVQFTFSECMHNGVRPRLLGWRSRHVHSSDEEMMSDSSRTASFPIAPGDTVSFYREFKWYNPKEQRQDTDNFRSLDTIDYAVELVKSSTGQRIILLDSIGVLARSSFGAPTIYGTRPIIAKVNYKVPLSVGTDTAFVRVRMYSRGEGAYLPIRKDDYTVGASHALDLGIWDYYLSLYGGSLSKRDVRDFTIRSSKSPSLLTVSNTAHDAIAIRFSEPSGYGPVELAIYDAAGNRVFVPYAARSMQAAEVLTYHATSSGTYFVVLLRGGAIIEVKKITISL